MNMLLGLNKEFIILDGATGTELRRLGMPLGVCTEQWVMDNPEPLINLQRAYADAGSDAVYAPTFGLNRISLSAHGIGQADLRSWARELVDFSRKAVGGRCLIGGDIAPTGAMPPPVGELSYDELLAVFAEQASALENAGVDFYAVETQMSVYEARIIVEAVRSVSSKPVLVSFSVTDTGRSIYGDSLADAFEVFRSTGAAGFGINCCGDLTLLLNLLAGLPSDADLSLIAKPNAGLPTPSPLGDVYSMSPAELAASVPRFAAAGARYIGGCCGTNAAHIEAIRQSLTALR